METAYEVRFWPCEAATDVGDWRRDVAILGVRCFGFAS